MPAKGNEGEDGYVPAQPGGLGEEDIVTLVLPYAKSARDGVRILGDLLERYGTYENNGIAFSDVDEVWWLETIGGHHWMARRVPDDVYVVMPNQLGLDTSGSAPSTRGLEVMVSVAVMPTLAALTPLAAHRPLPSTALGTAVPGPYNAVSTDT